MQLTIEKAIYGGAGLARSQGKAVFVPFTLPGERVEARIAGDRGSYAEAELVGILDPSPARAHPPCPSFGECGGCHYQHAAYAEQLEIKRQILIETLARAHLSSLPEVQTLSAAPLRYRNRSRFHIDRATARLSYKKRASHANLPVDVCPIAAPLIEQSLHALNANSDQWQLQKHFEEVELFTNGAQDEMLLTLWTRSSPAAASAALSKLWPAIQQALPRVTGAAVFSSESGKQTGRLLASTGAASLTYAAAGQTYRVSIGSFFQVNRHLLDPLAALVANGAAGARAWDLYAGVGLFARALSSSFDQVVAVESAPRSVEDLRHNLAAGPHRIVAAATLEFLRRARAQAREAPDFVIVDPPRAGLGKEVTALLGEIRPPRITYVSCDPATLSRDLKSLLDSGYSLEQLHLVDMFPQTFHLETVARLALK